MQRKEQWILGATAAREFGELLSNDYKISFAQNQ